MATHAYRSTKHGVADRIMGTTRQHAAPEHRCLPRPERRCLACGDPIAPPIFCEVCGEDISAPHRCSPHPLDHVCSPVAASRRCVACDQPLPETRYCPTCGAELVSLHQCTAAPIPHVPRPDPIHICPALELQRCLQCGNLMPALVFCEKCGMDITPPHACPPRAERHVCPPLATMPRRCGRCGELLPARQHCIRCGADTTPSHICP